MVDVSGLTAPWAALFVALNVAGAAATVSGFMLLLAAPFAKVPGLRPEDETRNAGLRVLHGVATLGLVLFSAWSQNIVIPRAALIPLLAMIASASAVANLTYAAAKTVARSKQPIPYSLTPLGRSAAGAFTSGSPLTTSQVQSQGAAAGSPLTGSTDTRTSPVAAANGAQVQTSPVAVDSALVASVASLVPTTA